MKTIEEYAIDLVCEGAQHAAEGDRRAIRDDVQDHQAAVDLAAEIAQAIRANPAAVLALVGRDSATGPVAHLAECEPEQREGWERMPYREALELGAAMCERTQYMADELFPDEEVWVKRAGVKAPKVYRYGGRVQIDISRA